MSKLTSVVASWPTSNWQIVERFNPVFLGRSWHQRSSCFFSQAYPHWCMGQPLLCLPTPPSHAFKQSYLYNTWEISSETREQCSQMAKADPKKPKGNMSVSALFACIRREDHERKPSEVPGYSESWRTMSSKETSKFDKMAKADKVALWSGNERL